VGNTELDGDGGFAVGTAGLSTGVDRDAETGDNATGWHPATADAARLMTRSIRLTR